jgi:hypothetical protein
MGRLLIAILGCAFVVACSDPKNTPLPTDMGKMETIKPQFEKLTDDEKKLVAAYMLRKSMQGTIFGGAAGTTDAATIGQAIDNQRAFVAAAEKRDAEEKALKAKLQAEREAAMKAMRDVVTVALVSKKIDVERGYSGIELGRRISIIVGYQNNGDKPIAGVKGTLVIKDVFGDTLSRFRISNDDTLGPKQSKTWTGGRRLSSFGGDNKDEKFAELPDDKIKVDWEPDQIVFTDGSKLSAPESRGN